jgi:hypothetical protein
MADMGVNGGGLPASLTFGDVEITIIDHQGRPWLTAADLARALGYKRADKVGRLYDRHADEFTDEMTACPKLGVKGFGSGESEKPVRLFSPRGCHLVAMLARTGRAKAFRRWVLDVLEQLAVRPAAPVVPADLVADPVAAFLGTPAEVAGARIGAGTLHRAYQIWAVGHGGPALAFGVFCRAVTRLGFPSVRRSGVLFFCGLKLLEMPPPAVTPLLPPPAAESTGSPPVPDAVRPAVPPVVPARGEPSVCRGCALREDPRDGDTPLNHSELFVLRMVRGLPWATLSGREEQALVAAYRALPIDQRALLVRAAESWRADA